MKIIIMLISIFVFLKTLFYGIYEWKNQNNKIASITIFLLAMVCLIIPTIMASMRMNLSTS